MRNTVLVVDDDVRLATAIVARLRAAGFDVSHADCARSAIEAVFRLRPNAVVLDIRLPDMDGFEVCKRVRASPSLCSTPVIFLSGNSSQEDRRKAQQAGANGFCAKPCPHAELIGLILQLCSARALDTGTDSAGEAVAAEATNSQADKAPTLPRQHSEAHP